MAYLLDTNVVIDFFNAKLPPEAKNLLLGFEPHISVITSIELFSSTKTSETETFVLKQFIEAAKVYDNINPDIVDMTIAIRQKYRTKLPDAIIAATALVYNLELITRNTSDFENIQELKVLDPYTIK